VTLKKCFREFRGEISAARHRSVVESSRLSATPLVEINAPARWLDEGAALELIRENGNESPAVVLKISLARKKISA
jgi:hypothetical protein